MKTLIQITIAFTVFFIANNNPIQAQGECVQLFISSPSCCPSNGTAGGVHSVLGESNLQSFNGTGTFSVNIYWDEQFPTGDYTLLLWAETETVEVADRPYDAIKCYGESFLELSGSFNSTSTLSLSPIYIYEEEAPD